MPPFWTNTSLFPFNFTAFDARSAAILGYEWGIGSDPATDNVVALGPFTGTSQVSPTTWLSKRGCVFEAGSGAGTLSCAAVTHEALIEEMWGGRDSASGASREVQEGIRITYHWLAVIAGLHCRSATGLAACL